MSEQVENFLQTTINENYFSDTEVNFNEILQKSIPSSNQTNDEVNYDPPLLCRQIGRIDLLKRC